MFYVYKNIKMYIRGFICLVITKMPPLTGDEKRVFRFHGSVRRESRNLTLMWIHISGDVFISFTTLYML